MNALLVTAQTVAHPTPGPSVAGSTPLALFVLLGALSIVPFVLLVGTSFVKISVVLGIVRNALGTPQVPGNMVITGLAAILSLHIMAPTVGAVMNAAGPLLSRALTADLSQPGGTDALADAWTAAHAPLARFLTANSTERDRALFLDLAHEARARPGATLAPPAADDLSVLLPAFVVSELTSAFLLGFLIFLPFLVVDLVIANVLTALGLTALAPGSVAMPFKLLLFVLADGWYLICRALVLGYR